MKDVIKYNAEKIRKGHLHQPEEQQVAISDGWLWEGFLLSKCYPLLVKYFTGMVSTYSSVFTDNHPNLGLLGIWS